MNIATWLQQATARLEAAGIGTARLDSLILLEDCLHIDRAQLLAHPDRSLTSEHITVLEIYIKRRMAHEPLAYIRGKTEFYGRDFAVDKNVLEPRPESETMIDILKNLSLTKHIIIVDVGTGSGALAITAHLELPQARVIGVDIDPACLEIARRNARELSVNVDYFQGDLLQAVPSRSLHDLKNTTLVLLCNLPYVPDGFQINLAAGHEPRLAIFGGPDGLDLYRKLFEQLDSFSPKVAYVLTESLPTQHAQLAEIAASHHFTLSRTEDFVQVFRPK